MRVMRMWLGPVIVLSVAALGAGACSSSNSGGSGGTASGGSAGADSGSGSGGTSGSAGADGGSCHGDATKWATVTQPVSCTKNSDCCVVINGCLNQAQVVSKQNYDKGVDNLWPYCDKECTACMPPAVEVLCNNGQCGLKELDYMDASADKHMDHCGVDATPVVGPLKTMLGC